MQTSSSSSYARSRPVSPAGSNGRCNTIQCFDSRRLPRQKGSVWQCSMKTCAGQSIESEAVVCAKRRSCRRRAKFSRTRSSRERKELRIHPSRCRSATIMARISSELSEFSFALNHSFCRCTVFWRTTGLYGLQRRHPTSLRS